MNLLLFQRSYVLWQKDVSHSPYLPTLLSATNQLHCLAEKNRHHLGRCPCLLMIKSTSHQRWAPSLRLPSSYKAGCASPPCHFYVYQQPPWDQIHTVSMGPNPTAFNEICNGMLSGTFPVAQNWQLKLKMKENKANHIHCMLRNLKELGQTPHSGLTNKQVKKELHEEAETGWRCE